MTEDTARNYDEGKVRFELIPPDALTEVAKVFTYGAAKYTTPEHDGSRNWELPGLSEERHLGSLLRHIIADWSGEKIDPESGQSHMAMVATRALMILHKRLEAGCTAKSVSM